MVTGGSVSTSDVGAGSYDSPMLYVLVGLLVLLLLVCAARLLIIPGLWQWNWSLTAIAVGFVLYLPRVDHVMDPAVARSTGVDNVSDLGHVLLTLLAWCGLGCMSLRVLRREPPPDTKLSPRMRNLQRLLRGEQPTRWWLALNLATVGAVFIAWAASDMRHIEVDDVLQLSDGGSRALVLMYGGWALVGGVLVVTASTIGLLMPDDRRRSALWVMLLIGLCGIGYSVTAGVVAAIGGTYDLRAHALGVMEVWAIPGLALLAGSGAAGLRNELRRRRARA